jgi:hypothetical protein
MLAGLIDDLIDEACTKNKSGLSGSALYGYKDNNNNSKDGGKGKGKGNKGKDKTLCKTCGIFGVKHEPKDCLAVNYKKRKEWEEKNKKKWLYFDDFVKSKEKSNDKKGKTSKEEDKDEDRDVFGFIFITFDLITLTSDVISDISKNKGFSNYVMDLSVTSLLTLSLHDDYSSYIYLTPSSSFVTFITLVMSSTGRNRWLYDTGASKHVANDLS